MLVKPVKTKIFRSGAPLEDFILRFLPKVKDGSVIVITSKIVALSQGRKFRIKDRREKIRWIKRESEKAIKTKWCYLTLKEGHWCANAGIDESNVEGGGIILWPKDTYAEAERIRQALRKKYNVKRLGILITDSRIAPLRAGITGVALGYAGFRGLKNYIGKRDIFGRKLKMSQVNVADSLATAAVLVMGEGSERQPLALIEDSGVDFLSSKTKPVETRITPADDLYRPLYEEMEQ